jgi:hypothetical protein
MFWLLRVTRSYITHPIACVVVKLRCNYISLYPNALHYIEWWQMPNSLMPRLYDRWQNHPSAGCRRHTHLLVSLYCEKHATFINTLRVKNAQFYNVKGGWQNSVDTSKWSWPVQDIIRSFSYSGGGRFEPRTGHWFSWIKCFVIFSSPSR